MTTFSRERSRLNGDVVFPREIPIMGKYEWLAYVALAGLAWGTYVPIIFYGGNELSARPGPSGRFMAILCVGGAYFVIGVLLPLLMFVSGWAGVKGGDVNLGSSGLTFAGLGGRAGR